MRAWSTILQINSSCNFERLKEETKCKKASMVVQNYLKTNEGATEKIAQEIQFLLDKKNQN